MKRASGAARKLLRRALPPALARWIEQFAASFPSQESALSLAGGLAAIALDLRAAYLRSGSEVRELVWSLHKILHGEPTSPSAGEFYDFEASLRAALSSEPKSDASALRSLLFKWIDAATERLTMSRYHGRDHHRRHAAILIAGPWAWLAAREAEQVPSANEASAMLGFSELMLDLWDQLDAEAQAAIGRNRIARAESNEFGGFYGMAAASDPPSPEEIDKRLADLDGAFAGFIVAALPSEARALGSTIIEETRSSLAERIRKGAWPSDFQIPKIASGSSARPWWKKLLGSSSLLCALVSWWLIRT